jgi:hypothetical protein
MRALHEVGGGLPAHQRVLPAVTLPEHVPVHAPFRAVPGAGLGGSFGGLVDAGETLVWLLLAIEIVEGCVPDLSAL